MLTRLLIAALVMVAASPTATERPYALMVGDPAPALPVASWVQGDPVPRFEPGTIYVIDFWATWCGPCKKSMPELSALQKRFGDRVVFIALDTWDYADRVAPFVAEMGDKLTYRVAIDRQPAPPAGEDNIPMFVKANGECSKTWLQASGWSDEGIPALFVVDRSARLAWIGNEPAELEPVLTRMLANQWDQKKYSAEYARDAVVLKQGRTLESEIWEARQKKDWPAAIAGAKRLTALDPRYQGRAGLVFRLLYTNLGQRDEAIAYANGLIGSNSSAGAFTEMAEAIAADSTATAQHAAAGEKLARHAKELAGKR